MNKSVLLLLAGAACSTVDPGSGPVSEPEGPPVAVAALVPVSTAETGTSCSDGVDNDRNGRLDCEDALCADAPGCVEVCGNGLDDDNNGLADEHDEQCWAAHTASDRVTARVLGGGDLHESWNYSRDSYSGNGFWSRAVHSTRKLALESAWGTAQVTTAGSDVVHCSWGATGIAFGWRNTENFRGSTSYSTGRSSSAPIAVSRASSWVDSDCPVAPSSFLPVAMKTSARGHFGALNSHTMLGRRWYMASMPYFPDQFSSNRSSDWLGRSHDRASHWTATGALQSGASVVLVP